MTQNTYPIFGLKPNTGWVTVAAASTGNTACDGTGTVYTVFTAGANGSFVSSILARWAANTIYSQINLVRIYLNNGSTNATNTNNSFISETQLNAYTPTNSTSGNGIEIPIYKAIPANWNINISIPYANNSSLAFTCFGCDY